MLIVLSVADGNAADEARTQFPESILETGATMSALSPVVTAGPRFARRLLRDEEAAKVMTFEVAFRMRNQEELQQRVSRGGIVSTEEKAAKYFPADADYQAVIDWLTAEGLTITRRSENRLTLFISGTVSQIAKSFRTTFARVAAGGTEYSSAISTRVCRLSWLRQFSA